MPVSEDVPKIFRDIAAGFASLTAEIDSLKVRVALLELEACGEEKSDV
jgi:hypothetical protein